MTCGIQGKKEGKKGRKEEPKHMQQRGLLGSFVSCLAHAGKWDRSWMDVGMQRPERHRGWGNMRQQPFIAKLVHKRLQSTATLVQRVFLLRTSILRFDRRGGRSCFAVDECFEFVGGTYGSEKMRRAVG